MKKKIVLTVALVLFSLKNYSQDISVDKKELHDLLESRKQKFGSYSSSLSKRSGIFGNKTKRDIQKSNEVLIDIVKTDNMIISSLNRVVDFRNFEKTNMNYDIRQRDDELQNLRKASDTLAKQVDVLTLSNAKGKSQIKRLRWSVYLLSALVIFFYFYFRKRAKVISPQD